MRPEGCLSNYALDRLAAGELADASTAEWHLGGCARCAARRLELGRARDGFRAAPPPLASRRSPAPTWWIPSVAAATTMAAAAAVLLLLPDRELTRRKGSDPRVEAFVQHQGAVRAAGPGEPVTPGDGIQLAVTTFEPRQVGVVGVDAAATVTVYRPTEPLPAGASQPLDFSITLDEVVGTERIWVLVCEAKTPLDGFVADLRAAPGSEPTPPSGCTASRVELEKSR